MRATELGLPTVDNYLSDKEPPEYQPARSCEFYDAGFCAVHGGVCPHYEHTLKSCRTRQRALSDRETLVALSDSQFAGLVRESLSETK